MKKFADFNFNGWGAYTQFNFAMTRDIRFGSNEIIFMLWRRIVTGYDGYEYAPKLNDAAK